MKKLFLLPAFIFTLLNINAQQFHKIYSNQGYTSNGYYFKGKRLIAPTPDNGIIFTGRDNLGNMNITKLNSMGCTEWTKAYDFGIASGGSLIKKLNDNNYLLGGNLSDGTEIILKVSTWGNVIWAKKIGYNGEPSDAAQTGNELVIVDGYSANDAQSSVLRLDQTNGNIISMQEISRTPIDVNDIHVSCSIFRVIPASFGGYYLVGQMLCFPNTQYRKGVLIYMDPSGNFTSCKTFATNDLTGSNASIDDIINLSGNKLLIALSFVNDASYIPAFPNSAQRMALLETDNFSNIYWKKFYDETTVNYVAYHVPNSIAVTNSGDFLIAGISDDGYPAGINYIFKTDANGNVIGNLHKFTVNNTGATSLYKTPANDFILNLNGEGIVRLTDNLDDLCNTQQFPFTAQVDTEIHIDPESIDVTDVTNGLTVSPITYTSFQNVQTICGDECLPPPCYSVPPTTLNNGLLAYYPFGGGSIDDYSGNGHHLTNTTSAHPTLDRNGNANCAYNFTKANNDFLTLASPTFLNNITTAPFSISLWYQPLGTRPGGDYELLIGRDAGLHCPDTYGQWSVGLYDCRHAFVGFDMQSRFQRSAQPNCNINLNNISNNWHHLAYVFTGNAYNLYVNGVLYNNVDGPCGSLSANIGDLFLGKEYTGDLDDLFIYNRALSVTEVTQLFHLGSSCCGYNPLIICPGSGTRDLYSELTGTNYQWQVDNGSGSGYTNVIDDANYSGSSSPILHLQNMPSLNYGNQYRCIVDGNYSYPVSIKFYNIWTGAVNNDWENPGNWSCNSIPDANTDIIINSGTVIINSNAICRSAYINPSVNLTVNTGFSFTITH